MMMGGMGFNNARRGHPDEEVFGAVYDKKVVRRLLPYILPFKRLAIISAFSASTRSGSQSSRSNMREPDAMERWSWVYIIVRLRMGSKKRCM